MALVTELALGFWHVILKFFTPRGMQAEWAIAVAGMLLALLLPRLARKPLHSAQAAFAQLARRKWAAIAIAGLFPVILRLALLPVMPVPVPSVHDEFSHLLLGDTLASGRLTNATHPLWEHFESIHVISRPTYNSMYLPGLGIALAAGQRWAGHPWFGVIGAVGIMCASVCWMLQTWAPPGWALFGALMFASRTAIYGPYMNSYLGGEVPAIGGALILGALGRMMKSCRPMHAAVIGIGLTMVVNSRPWEAVWMGVATAVVVVLWLRKSPAVALRVFARRALVPFSAVLFVGGATTAYYCWRVTGSPLTSPYQVNLAAYGWPVNLAILPAKPMTHRHKAMHDHYRFERSTQDNYSRPMRVLNTLFDKVNVTWRFLFGPVLSLPLLALPLVFLDQRVRYLLVFAAVMLLSYLPQLILLPQYLGPVAALLYALWVQAARHIYVWGVKKHPAVVQYMRLTPLLCLLLIPERIAARPLGLEYLFWDDPHLPHQERYAALSAQLQSMPGKQLVIVQYGPNHSSHEEWVYNRADIDGAKVVWARDMGQDFDQRLATYFKDRNIWFLDPDAAPPVLKPYRWDPGQ